MRAERLLAGTAIQALLRLSPAHAAAVPFELVWVGVLLGLCLDIRTRSVAPTCLIFLSVVELLCVIFR